MGCISTQNIRIDRLVVVGERILQPGYFNVVAGASSSGVVELGSLEGVGRIWPTGVRCTFAKTCRGMGDELFGGRLTGWITDAALNPHSACMCHESNAYVIKVTLSIRGIRPKASDHRVFAKILHNSATCYTTTTLV